MSPTATAGSPAHPDIIGTHRAGYDLLLHPGLNRGTAFTEEERTASTACCRLTSAPLTTSAPAASALSTTATTDLVHNLTAVTRNALDFPTNRHSPLEPMGSLTFTFRFR